MSSGVVLEEDHSEEYLATGVFPVVVPSAV